MGGKTELLRIDGPGPGPPPILTGRQTAAVEAQVRSFYQSVAQIFDRWVTRRSSAHTQRAYRQDVLSFIEFIEISWPEESTRLFTVSVADVLAFRDVMLEESKAPKTINRRIASLSSFYKYLQACALRVQAPDHGTEPGSCPVHRSWVVRPSR